MIAANISTQPESSRTESACPNITQPAINEITDSRLRIKDATVKKGKTPSDSEGVFCYRDILGHESW